MKKNRVEKYIEIVEVVNVGRTMRRTKTWNVVNVRVQQIVGQIKWWGAWRKYVFFPYPDTLYDHDCLRLIAAFGENLTKEHYANKVGNKRA